VYACLCLCVSASLCLCVSVSLCVWDVLGASLWGLKCRILDVFGTEHTDCPGGNTEGTSDCNSYTPLQNSQSFVAAPGERLVLDVFGKRSSQIASKVLDVVQRLDPLAKGIWNSC
jgi:hypothetical protein